MRRRRNRCIGCRSIAKLPVEDQVVLGFRMKLRGTVLERLDRGRDHRQGFVVDNHRLCRVPCLGLAVGDTTMATASPT
jgi:hypothetical protein